MKNRILTVVLAAVMLIVMMCSFASAESVCIMDGAGLLKSTEVDSLKLKIVELRNTYGLDIAIVTTNSTNGKKMYDYCEDLYQRYGLGVGERKDGVMLLIDMSDRGYYVYGFGPIGNRVEGGIKDSAFTPSLSEARYAKAFMEFLNQVKFEASRIPASYREGKGSAYAMDRVKEILPVLLIAGAVVALIVVLVLRGKMKTANGKRNATDYMVPDSFRLDRALDLYLYTTTTRTKIESSSSGSRGGGGGSHGSGHGGHF